MDDWKFGDVLKVRNPGYPLWRVMYLGHVGDDIWLMTVHDDDIPEDDRGVYKDVFTWALLAKFWVKIDD